MIENLFAGKRPARNRYNNVLSIKARGRTKWKKLILAIVENPLLIAIVVFCAVMLTVIAVGLSTNAYNRDFFINVLANAHGTLIDIFVIGILILWLNRIGESRAEIQRYHEEIEDFRGWESEEASRRIRGIIKRLNNAGVTKINLEFTFLPKMNLKNINLEGSSLTHADLRDTFLQGANLANASLSYAKMQGAHLNNVDFNNADLNGAYLQNASFGSLLSGIDDIFLKPLDFTNASLEGADLRGVTYLSAGQLATARTLYNAKLDTILLQQIREEYPRLLEKPEGGGRK
jgi:uncharacterized protein YjbI with pentapeptide repeats